MLIAIPTYGRAHKQRTWDRIPHELKRNTILVIQSREYEAYKKYEKNLVVLPPEIKDIASTRDYIIDYTANFNASVVMCDDDLDFATRLPHPNTLFRESNEDDVAAMFMHLQIALQTYVHVGVSAREGANRVTENWLYNTRAIRVTGYQPEVLRKHKIRFRDLQFMEDFHVTLSLLKLGYPNAVLNMYCHNQPGSNTVGGCSGQRTAANQEAAARKLAELHAPFVTVVEKKTKTSWGGKERYDVRIQWKKAYEFAVANRSDPTFEVLDGGTGKDTDAEGKREAEAMERR